MRMASCLWKISKNVHFVRFYGVPSLAHFTPFLSDPGYEEQSSDSGNECNPSYYTKSSDFSESPKLRPSEVLEILRNLRNEPFSALSFFYQLQVDGFQHDVQCYIAIIKILCHRNGVLNKELDSLFIDIVHLEEHDLCFKMPELLEAMANEVISGGSSSLILAFSSLVKSLVSVGLFDKAFDTLCDIKRQGVTPCLFSCNYLIRKLADHGETDLAVAVYRNMKDLGLNPNTFTFAILVNAYTRDGNFEKIWELFLEMEKDGAPNIDAYTYNLIIRGLARQKRMPQAEIVFLGMLKRGLEVNYPPLIHGYCQSGNIKKAITACIDMENNGKQADCVILTDILQCLCMNDMPKEAILQFSKFKAERNVVDKVAYNVAMDAFCKMGQLDEALKLFWEMRSEKLIPDVVHCTTLINGCCLHGKIENAKNLFVEMKGKGVQPDDIVYDVVAGGIAQLGHLDEVFSILDEMKSQGLTPSPLTHNKIIEGLFSAGQVGEAENYFKNVYPKSIDNYASMINGYCTSGRATVGHDHFNYVLNRCDSKAGRLVSKCGFKLMSSLCSEGKKARAIELFKTLLHFSNETDMITYGKLIHALCCAGDMTRARWVFDQIIGKGLSPNVILYTMLMHGYLQANSPGKSIDLLTEMKASGIYPDTIAYTVLLDGLSKTTRQKDGLISELLNDMKEMKIKPDLDLYTVLIDHHCKCGNISDAVSLFTQMVEGGLISPDVFAYTALMSGYCNEGDLAKADELLKEMMSKGIQPDKRTLLLFDSKSS